jgi:hypothetical protein
MTADLGVGVGQRDRRHRAAECREEDIADGIGVRQRRPPQRDVGKA